MAHSLGSSSDQVHPLQGTADTGLDFLQDTLGINLHGTTQFRAKWLLKSASLFFITSTILSLVGTVGYFGAFSNPGFGWTVTGLSGATIILIAATALPMPMTTPRRKKIAMLVALALSITAITSLIVGILGGFRIVSSSGVAWSIFGSNIAFMGLLAIGASIGGAYSFLKKR